MPVMVQAHLGTSPAWQAREDGSVGSQWPPLSLTKETRGLRDLTGLTYEDTLRAQDHVCLKGEACAGSCWWPQPTGGVGQGEHSCLHRLQKGEQLLLRGSGQSRGTGSHSI